MVSVCLEEELKLTEPGGQELLHRAGAQPGLRGDQLSCSASQLLCWDREGQALVPALWKALAQP